MEDQFVRLGLSATRIEAVTPADIPAEDIARYCDDERPVFRRPSQLGCSMSHEKVWRTMLEAGHDRAVVMEDDALLSASLPPFLESLEGIEFDLLRFEGSGRKVRMLPAAHQIGNSVALRPFRSTLGGSSGYVISARAARKIIGHQAMRTRAVDSVLYNCLNEPGKGLIRYQSDPALCVQMGDINAENRKKGVGWSDLNAGGRRHRFKERHPVGYFLFRLRSGLKAGLQSSFDQIAHLPKGISKQSIAFRKD